MRLVQFRLLDPEPLLFHNEYVMDGERVGLLTSGSYGPALGAAIGMGWVPIPTASRPTSFVRPVSRSKSPASAIRPRQACAPSMTPLANACGRERPYRSYARSPWTLTSSPSSRPLPFTRSGTAAPTTLTMP